MHCRNCFRNVGMELEQQVTVMQYTASRSFILFTRYHHGDKIYKYEISRECGMYVCQQTEMHTLDFSWKKSEGQTSLKTWIILKYI